MKTKEEEIDQKFSLIPRNQQPRKILIICTYIFLFSILCEMRENIQRFKYDTYNKQIK